MLDIFASAHAHVYVRACECDTCNLASIRKLYKWTWLGACVDACVCPCVYESVRASNVSVHVRARIPACIGARMLHGMQGNPLPAGNATVEKNVQSWHYKKFQTLQIDRQSNNNSPA